MSEQATVDHTSRIEESLFKTFGGEEPAPAAPSGKPRDESGRFAKTGRDEQDAVQEEEAAPAEALETEQQGQANEAAPPKSEEVEVEIEGEKYIVPKKISDRFIQHADYTRKTQDLAEMRRVAAAEREMTVVAKAFDQATQQERQHLSLLDAQIAQYQNVNWGQMETQDLLRTRAQLDQLKEARAEIAKAVDAKRADLDAKIKSHTQEALQAGQRYIEQKIKGFDDSKKKQLLDYGLSEGYTQEELSKVIDPRVVVSLWKAAQWDALQASNPVITKRAQQAAPVVRPGATQPQPSRVKQLTQAIEKAPNAKAKQAATEDYLAHRLGGGR